MRLRRAHRELRGYSRRGVRFVRHLKRRTVGPSGGQPGEVNGDVVEDRVRVAELLSTGRIGG